MAFCAYDTILEINSRLRHTHTQYTQTDAGNNITRKAKTDLGLKH